MTGRKEEFNQWISSVFDNLREKYINCDLNLDTESLEKKHGYQLWRIFESHVECPHKGAEEQMEFLEIADSEASWGGDNPHETLME
jgi:hypothetical protein